MLIAPPFMLTTGPVPAYPSVRQALGGPLVYDGNPVFQAFYAGLVDKLGHVMRLTNKPVILQGDALLGLEAAAASLIGPDDPVLTLASGVYGQGFGVWSKRYGAEVLELTVPFDEAIAPELLSARLQARPDIRVVTVCHHDTPSGTLNPVAEIGRIVRAHGAYLIVDAVSSFGGMDVHPEAVFADIFVASAAKCLGAPPGLTLLGVSERAWAKIKANPTAPRQSFLSLLDWEQAWRPDRPFPVTPSLADINALDAALDRHLAEGAEAVWARHAATAAAARAGLKALGLALWPKSEAIAAPTATVFRVPEGIVDTALRERVLNTFGVLLSLGRGATAGRVLRIAHMGVTAQPLLAIAAVTAIGAALRSLGRVVDVGAGVEAALAALEHRQT